MRAQPLLFEAGVPLPEGFLYRPDFISVEEQRELLEGIGALTFSTVEMRGGIARRRVVHFGWSYGFDARTTAAGEPLPPFLLPLRERTGAWAGRRPEDFAEALVTEYPPGAPIGWHRDAPMFGDVAGISLLAASTMKFRPYQSPAERPAAGHRRMSTHAIELAPRSAYLITGVARRGYEHHIPPVRSLRYSITFRTVRQ